MVETDALSNFDFNKVSGGGLFLKFEAGKPVKLRLLTVDPLMNVDLKFGGTYFGFIVWNFNEDKAQILNATPGVAKRIGALHVDKDFGANIRKVDVKISPTGEKLERKYDIQVLPNADNLTNEQIKEASAIDLEKVIGKGAGFIKRMSLYDPEEFRSKQAEFAPEGDDELMEPAQAVKEEDVVIEDIGDEPIDLDSIPF